MSAYCDEHKFVTETLMPFLQKNWDDIDLPEPASNKPDGRLTFEELQLFHERMLKEKKVTASLIMQELLFRYEQICRAHEDGYWQQEENILGISEADISVYAQQYDPAFRRRNGRPNPKSWL
jgi:hypothetical protein